MYGSNVFKVVEEGRHGGSNTVDLEFKSADGGEKSGFGAFSPFEDHVGLGQWSTAQQNLDTPEVDPAWDTSLALPISSPDSPSSVFQFFSNDDEDVVAADSKSDTLWNMSDSDFQAF